MLMSKVSKQTRGPKGLISRRAADSTGADLPVHETVDPADQFKDAEAVAPDPPPVGADDSPSEVGQGPDDRKIPKNESEGDNEGEDSTDVKMEDGEDGTPPSEGSLLNLNTKAPTSLAGDFRGGQESWNAMLYQLLLYKAQRGDLNVSSQDSNLRLLYNWVQTQRKHYKLYQENKTSSTFLNADRIAVLDAIDFQWNVRGDTFWQKNFDALVKYKNEHGDARVPRLYTKDPKLGEWVTDQRRQWKCKMEGKPSLMTDERKNKLNELGFVWKVRDRADWNDRYEQLLEFKKENGHCIVPQHYARNRALGKWVAKQREQYRFYREAKHSFLSEERIDLLKSVAFVWQIKGRGVNKKLPGKLPDPAEAEDKEKSLAKVEEEEKAKDDTFPTMPSIADASLNPPPMSPVQPPMGAEQQLPSLPTISQQISQQQLLQANMAAIAAHASSNQNMVADLAAALRLGGTNNPSATAAAALTGVDPRVAAALRAAQLGSDPNNQRPFSTML